MTLQPGNVQSGTTLPAEGEPGAQSPDPAGGSAGAADGDGGGISLDDLKAKSAAEKQRYEARIQELEEERERLAEAARQTPAGSGAHDARGRVEALRAQAEEFARKGDPVAAYTLERDAQRQAEADEDRRNQALAFQLLRMPETDRGEALKRYQQGGYRDIDHVRERLDTERKDQEVERLKREIEALKNRPEVNSVPGQGARSGPATPAKDVTTIPRAQWEHDQETLSDDDRRKQQRERREGRLRVD